jgi:hypothetical protein
MADEATVWTFTAVDDVSSVMEEMEGSVSAFGETVVAVSAAVADGLKPRLLWLRVCKRLNTV